MESVTSKTHSYTIQSTISGDRKLRPHYLLLPASLTTVGQCSLHESINKTLEELTFEKYTSWSQVLKWSKNIFVYKSFLPEKSFPGFEAVK